MDVVKKKPCSDELQGLKSSLVSWVFHSDSEWSSVCSSDDTPVFKANRHGEDVVTVIRLLRKAKQAQLLFVAHGLLLLSSD